MKGMIFVDIVFSFFFLKNHLLLRLNK